MLPENVPPGVTTSTIPVAAPAGTVVVISVGETTVNADAAPLNVTLVAPVRFVPKISMAAPTLPELGCVLTKGKSHGQMKIVP